MKPPICRHGLHTEDCHPCAQKAAPVAPEAAPKATHALPSRKQARIVYEAALAIPGLFTLAQLAVAAWQREKVLLGMEGYSTYPSDSKVKAVLSGAKGLVATGFIKKCGFLNTQPLFQAVRKEKV